MLAIMFSEALKLQQKSLIKKIVAVDSILTTIEAIFQHKKNKIIPKTALIFSWLLRIRFRSNIRIECTAKKANSAIQSSYILNFILELPWLIWLEKARRRCFLSHSLRLYSIFRFVDFGLCGKCHNEWKTNIIITIAYYSVWIININSCNGACIILAMVCKLLNLWKKRKNYTYWYFSFIY